VPGKLSLREATLDGQLRRALAGKTGRMGKRPAGLAAMLNAFRSYEFDRSQLRNCNFPVFYGYGAHTTEVVELQAEALGGLLPDVRIKRFAGMHHFVALKQIYTAEHIRALRELWGRR